MRYLLLIVLMCYSLVVNAQLFGRPVRYTTENGLTHNFCTSVAQDALGFMWIGTHEGLNRFDGTRFTPFLSTQKFRLPSNHITQLKKLSGNFLFVGTEVSDTKDMI